MLWKAKCNERFYKLKANEEELNFNLKSMQYDNKQTYYLVIADETGLQLPIKEAFQIDIAFAGDDFNFF